LCKTDWHEFITSDLNTNIASVELLISIDMIIIVCIISISMLPTQCTHSRKFAIGERFSVSVPRDLRFGNSFDEAAQLKWLANLNGYMFQMFHNS
jgi:hypothetical protein